MKPGSLKPLPAVAPWCCNEAMAAIRVCCDVLCCVGGRRLVAGAKRTFRRWKVSASAGGSSLRFDGGTVARRWDGGDVICDGAPGAWRRVRLQRGGGWELTLPDSAARRPEATGSEPSRCESASESRRTAVRQQQQLLQSALSGEWRGQGCERLRFDGEPLVCHGCATAAGSNRS